MASVGDLDCLLSTQVANASILCGCVSSSIILLSSKAGASDCNELIFSVAA